MKILIVGCGKTGRSAGLALSQENHDVTVMDTKPERIAYMASEMDVLALVGSGISHSDLLEAGIADTDILIAVTGNDELNLLCCLLAKRLGARHTIARVRNPEYAEFIQELGVDLGISMIINPEKEAAGEIVRSLALPTRVSSEVFSTKSAELYKTRIAPGSVLDGIQVKDIPTRLKSNILLCMVERRDKTFIPDGNFRLEKGDKISIMGSLPDINAFFHKIQVHTNKIEKVMVIGAGKVAWYLGQMLQDSRIKLTIIEMDEKAAQRAAIDFPRDVIIMGNASDEELLLDEGLRDMDAFVALTGIDEENVVLSLYAASVADVKTITKINRIQFNSLLESLDLDVIVNPKKLLVEKIIHYVRAATSGEGSNMESIHQLGSDQAEGLEFLVKKGSRVENIPLMDLNLKPGTLVAMILRGTSVILPRGTDKLQAGDRVVVITTNTGLCDLDQFVEGEVRS